MGSKPLGRGSLLGGSPEGKLVIGLVIVCVVLAAVAFALFAANQSQDKSLQAKQAELDAAMGNLSVAAQDLTKLQSNYTLLNGHYALLGEQLDAVQANYENVSARYLALQNKSDTVDTRLNTFLEDAPTIAYTYTIVPRQLSDNTTQNVLTVTAYNLGKTDADSIRMKCAVRLGNTTAVYDTTFASVMSLDKRVYSWEFSNETVIESVWAGLD